MDPLIVVLLEEQGRGHLTFLCRDTRQTGTANLLYYPFLIPREPSLIE
jgi:hypothetical protein